MPSLDFLKDPATGKIKTVYLVAGGGIALGAVFLIMGRKSGGTPISEGQSSDITGSLGALEAALQSLLNKTPTGTQGGGSSGGGGTNTGSGGGGGTNSGGSAAKDPITSVVNAVTTVIKQGSGAATGSTVAPTASIGTSTGGAINSGTTQPHVATAMTVPVFSPNIPIGQVPTTSNPQMSVTKTPVFSPSIPIGQVPLSTTKAVSGKQVTPVFSPATPIGQVPTTKKPVIKTPVFSPATPIGKVPTAAKKVVTKARTLVPVFSGTAIGKVPTSTKQGSASTTAKRTVAPKRPATIASGTARSFNPARDNPN